MKIQIKKVSLIIISILFLIGFTSYAQAVNASEEWPVSVGDEYYIIWKSNAYFKNSIPVPTETNPLIEKVQVVYTGGELAAHEQVPTTYFPYSINVTGEYWNGLKWENISSDPNALPTQMTLWNDGTSTWFCGALFSGTPVIAPSDLSSEGRKNTILTNCGVLWGAGTIFSENTSLNPNSWTFKNLNKILVVSYDETGFLYYYKLSDGINTFECNIQKTEPELPEPSNNPQIPGFPMMNIIIFSILGASILFLYQKNGINY